MRGAGLIAALIAGVWLVSGVFIVQEGQTVITTLGNSRERQVRDELAYSISCSAA
jgi:regulator of protease activity HflC (stomatin/prohibitin superfamily)